jgi:hypothetical protein
MWETVVQKVMAQERQKAGVEGRGLVIVLCLLVLGAL